MLVRAFWREERGRQIGAACRGCVTQSDGWVRWWSGFANRLGDKSDQLQQFDPAARRRSNEARGLCAQGQSHCGWAT